MHELLNSEAIVKALAYLMANPVEAGAVRYAKEWPGAQTMPRDLGRRVIDVKRPEVYFDETNDQWPDRLQVASRHAASIADRARRRTQSRSS